MKRVIHVFALLIATSVFGQTAATKIADGRAALAAHDMPTAHARFAEAVALDSSDQTANALLGLTRLFDLTEKSSSQTLLDGLGVTQNAGATGDGRDIYNWDAALPHDAHGNVTLPSNYNFTTLEAFWQGTLIPESVAARANFAAVTNPGFLITLTPAETKMPMSLNIDYADMLMSRVCLRAAEFLAHWGSGQNLDANLDGINQALQGNLFTIQKVLADNPNFLLAGSPSERTAAKAALLDMIATYRQASVALRARPAGVHRLFMLDPKELQAEAQVRQMLDQIEQSLTEPISLGKQSLFTGPLFDATWSARAELPTFSATGFDVMSVPDASLGGILTGFTKESLAAALSDPHDTLAELGWEWVTPKPMGNTLYKYLALPGGKHLVTGNGGTHLTSTDGTTWTYGHIPGLGQFVDAATDGAGKIVGVSYDGFIYVSTDDGVTWRRVFRDNAGFTSIAYGGGKYVAVGNSGLIATSTDGETWTESFPNNFTHNKVIYTGSLFVVLSSDDVMTFNTMVFTSPDGLAWTQRYNANLAGDVLTSVAQNGSVLVALITSGYQQLTSVDGGLSWTVGPGPGVISDITYSMGKFVAVGANNIQVETASANGTIGTTGDASVTVTGAGIAGSPLTLSVPVTSGDTASLWAGAVRTALSGNSAITALYAVGGSGNQIILTRLAANWNDSTLNIALANGTCTGIQAAANSANTVTGSLNGGNGVIKTSSDNGASWTPVSTSETVAFATANAGASATYVLGQGGVMLTSADNVTFTRALTLQTATSLAPNRPLLAIKAMDGYLYAGGGNNSSGGAVIIRSADGQTFTNVSITGTANNIADFVRVDSTHYFAVGNSGTILTTADGGSNWTQVTTNTSSNLFSIAYLNGKFYATTQGSKILTSPDGASNNWTLSGQLGPVGGMQMNGIAYGNGVYVLVGGSNNAGAPLCYVLTSLDGSSWTQQMVPTSETLKGIVFYQGVFTAVGTGGVVLRSTDGSNWWRAGSNVIQTNLSSISVLDGKYYATQVPSNLSGTIGESQSAVLMSSDAENWVRVPIGTANGPNRVELFNTRLYTANGNATIMRSQTIAATTLPGVTVLTPSSAYTNTAQGHSLTLAVAATSNGAVTYQWWKGATLLTGETGSSLTLNNIQTGDAGTYTVVVTNAAGPTTSSDMLVTVDANAVAPVITAQPEPQMVNVGLDAMFSVEATGTTPFYYQWKKDGVNLTDTGNVSGATAAMLRITGLTAADAGTYTVVVSNDAFPAGTTSDPAVLTVDSNPAYNYTTLAGSVGFIGNTDATGTAATFNNPQGVAVDASGNVYVASKISHNIRKITPAGVVTTIAGSTSGASGFSDATGTAALFNQPYGVAVNPAGTILYVADNGNNRIRKVDLSTFAVTTMTSSASTINALAVDSSGNVYYTGFDQTVRKVIPAGTVSVFAGSNNSFGSANGTGTSARFNNPQGIAIDATGANLYVADSSNVLIRKIVISSAAVTTYAGQAGFYGTDDGPAFSATFNNPVGIAVDSLGNVLVTENNANIIRKISPAGVVSTIGGQAWNGGFNNGPDGDARFSGPAGIAVDGSNNLYIAENFNQVIRKGTPVTPLNAPIIGFSPQSQSVNVGGNASFNVIASGVSSLTYQWRKDGVVLSNSGNISGATTAMLNVTNVQTSDAGGYTVLVTSNEGTALSAPATLTVSVAPVISVQPVAQSVNVGGAISLSVTATDSGDITYQWRRNGVDIAGATGSSYSVPTAQRSDAAVYDVVLNGVGGTAISSPTVVSVAPTSFPGHLAFDPTFSGNPLLTISCRVYTALALPSGKWMVGGEFVAWDSTPRSFLARLNADYSLDTTWTPPVINGFVYALARSPAADGSIYVGGEFTAVGGHVVPGLFRLKGSDRVLDLSWRAQDSPPNASVTALAVQPDGKLLVARQSTVTGQVLTTGTNVLRRLNSDGTLDATFSVDINTNNNFGNRLNAIIAEPTGGKIVFAGAFFQVNGSSRNGIARVDSTGANETTFGGTAGTNNQVYTMSRLSDGSYLIGGAFGNVAGTGRNRAAIINADGTLNGFAPLTAGGLNGNVLGAAVDTSGRIILTGNFTSANGNPTDSLVRLTNVGGVDTLYPSGATTTGYATTRTAYVFPQADGSIALFGPFQAVLNQRRVGIAVIAANNTLAASPAPFLFRPSYTGSAFALGSQTMVFGSIEAAGSTGPLHEAVRLNDDGSLDSSFPVGTGYNLNGLSTFGIYRAVQQGDGKILAVGDLSGYNGSPGYRMVRVNANGTYDGSFNAGGGPSNVFPGLLGLSGNRTLLYNLSSGYTFNGQGVNTALRLNEDGSRDYSFNVGTGINANTVTVAYEQPDGKLVLSGNFTSYNGTTVNGLMRLNQDGSLDGTFSAGTGVSGVNFITGLPDGRLLLTGFFTTYNGTPVNHVVLVTSTGAIDGSFTAPAAIDGAAGQVIVQEDGKLIIIGDFTGTPTPYAVRLTATGGIDSTFGLHGLTGGFGSGVRIFMGVDGSLYTFNNPVSFNYGVPLAVARFRGAPVAPTIGTDPASLMAPAGSTATFAVHANGTAPFTYQWRKDTVPLTDGGNVNGTNYSVLNLTNLSAGDAGNYDVVITGVTGSPVTSAAATLTIGSPQAAITTQPVDVVGTIGQPATLSVTVSGEGPFTYQWRRNGVNVGTNSPTLSIGSVSGGDAGYYTVTVTNALGSVTSAGAVLTIPLAAGAGVEAIDPAFVRPQFRRMALPGRITADQVTGGGKIYATWKNGSTVTGANNQRIGAVVRLNADGTLDNTFNTGSFLADAWVVVPMANGQVLVGGLAGSENGESSLPLFRVFRFNSDGSNDSSYNSPVFSAIPRYMTLQTDGKLLVAPSGGGTSNGGLSNLVRLNTDGSQDGTFSIPTFDGGAATNSVFATILVDATGKILIGGTFTSVNGTAREGVARLNADGTLDTSFVPAGFTRDGSKQVRGLGFQTQGANAGKILVAGRLIVSAIQRPVVRLNSDGSFDNTFTLMANNQVIGANGVRSRLLNMLPNDQFTIVSDAVTRFNADGTLDGFYTRPVFSLETFWMDTLPDGSVLVAPEFGTTVNSNPVTAGPIRFTSSGSIDGTFTPPVFQTEVYPGDFAIRPDGKVLVWGNFDTVNTTARHGMALLNTDGSLDAFNLSGVANLYSVSDAALLGSGKILAGTLTGSYSGLSSTGSPLLANGVARFNTDGTVDGTFTLDASANPGALHLLPDESLLTWTLDANSLLNGGLFFKRLTVDGAIDNSFTGLGSTVFGAVYRNGDTTIKTVVQGRFEVAGHYADGRTLVIATVPDGSYADGAATLDFTVLRLNANGTIDGTFTAPVIPWSTSSGFTSLVTDPLNVGLGLDQYPLISPSGSPFSGVALQPDATIIVYGAFTSLGGHAAPGIARLTSTGAFDVTYSVGTGPAVNAAGHVPFVQNVKVAPDGKTWITGLFDTFNGVTAPGLARLNPDGSVDTALATQIAYRPYLGNGTKVGFGASGEVYVAGTYAQPFEPFPFALHRLVGTVAPGITTHPLDQSVTVGDDVTFNVAVTPGLTVAYQWFKGGVAITGATRSTLTLKNVQLGDAASYTVVVTNAISFATSNAAVLTISSPGGTFSAWQAENFTSDEITNHSELSGPNAVYGQDGLPNLVKYALGLDPKQNITTGLPTTSTAATDWVYTYTRRNDRTDVTCTVEFSTNLTTWTSVGLTDTFVSTSGSLETRQATYPLASATNIYFRLKVTQP